MSYECEESLELLSEPDDSTVARASVFLGGCRSTTAALRAFAAVVGTEFEDAGGAALLEAFAEQFARHEAKTL